MSRSPELASNRRTIRPPWGVIALALALYGSACMALAAALIVRTDRLADLPRWVLVFGALVTTILATGLMGRRRWAWFASLAFVAVNAVYLLLGAAVLGENALAGGVLLALVAAYLLRPQIRAVFLGH